eukprot:MONOS_9373.1-p1 / transcript=MONOS_9373.1 / gene=MONOS_9373 / organism=Monocercomonoides_exilis_PA203 / gene_product=kinesin 14A / transcript_product=kinesin 14A / location=Mono_scaffold00384:53593-56041(-) / protein_length=719 / sequence_SO=supercontig / SO=protein_coding / is_pseudo=false
MSRLIPPNKKACDLKKDLLENKTSRTTPSPTVNTINTTRTIQSKPVSSVSIKSTKAETHKQPPKTSPIATNKVSRNLPATSSRLQNTTKSTSSKSVSQCSNHQNPTTSSITTSKRPSWDVKGKLADLEKRFDELVGKLEQSGCKEQELTVEVAHVQAEANEKETQKTFVKSKLQELKSASDAVQFELTETKRTNEDLSSKLIVLQKKLSSSEEERESLKKSLDERGKILSEAEERHNIAAIQMKAIKDQCDNQTNELEHLKEELKEREKTMEEMKKQSQEDENLRRKLHNKLQLLKGTIRVFCRLRPTLPGEESDGGKILITSNGEDQKIELRGVMRHEDSLKAGERAMNYSFCYDRVFPSYADNGLVFEEVSQLVQSALDGYSVCIFCYGATGSGKTFTMMGPGVYHGTRLMMKKRKEMNDMLNSSSSFSISEQSSSPSSPSSSSSSFSFSSSQQMDICEEDNLQAAKEEEEWKKIGIIPRAAEQIFEATQELKEKGWDFDLKATFLEIYMEQIRDLLRSNTTETPKYDIHHDGTDTIVDGLTVVPITSLSDVQELLRKASSQRSTASTMCNKESSRSHSVFTLKLTGKNPATGQVTKGVLNLIDLAGSERLEKSHAKDHTLNETRSINASLSALGDVFAARAANKAHIPYRNSKLTYLLQPCLSGDSKTLMLVNISPSSASLNETLCSLRFATLVGQVSVKTSASKKKMECTVEQI